MIFNQNSEYENLTQRIGRRTGQALKAVALLSGANRQGVTTVTAYLSQEESSPKFRHALEMERAYCKTLLSFDDIAPPDYGNSIAIDLTGLAFELGVARMYCVVTLGIDDTVSGWRDYDGVEVTVLDAVTQQLTGLQVRLERRVETAMPIRALQ